MILLTAAQNSPYSTNTPCTAPYSINTPYSTHTNIHMYTHLCIGYAVPHSYW